MCYSGAKLLNDIFLDVTHANYNQVFIARIEHISL